MRDWKRLGYTNTFKEMVDLFNMNTESAEFLDSMTGTILCNGVLYEGKETVEGMLVRPLVAVEVSGVVQSDTIFDNFTLYFRDTNKLVKLDMFPVDLLNYANGKPQFLYVKEDLTYRVSDYMFGAADEVLLARFIINTNSTWNQLYIIAQRAGTPMYNAADEFYNVEGMFIKSPGGLELSQTSGTVKRSGIDFTDKVSPDIRQFYNLATERLPLRYINNLNEVDYTKAPTYNIEHNKYMEYNMDKKLKIDCEEQIRIIQNLYYGIQNYSNAVAQELHDSIVSGGDINDLRQIVLAYRDYIDIIYNNVNNLYNYLGNPVLQSVRRAGLKDNKDLIYAYINRYLGDSVISTNISEVQVTAIRTIPSYILNIDLVTCPNPLENVLQEVQDGLNSLSFNAGEIKAVPSGKFTVQRILWDIYENVLVVQYGNKVYNNFNEAIEGTGLMEYPAPFGKTIYIPMAIMVVKSGITSINDDSESIIIDRRWIEVDQEQSQYADYIARARADKALTQIDQILTGILAVAKANTLKCTINGTTQYKDGDYFLNYDNLLNRVLVINNLTSSYNAKHALSAYQGKVLKDRQDDIVDGTITVARAGTLKYTNTSGTSVYANGDYFLNYNNFTNKPYVPTVINNLDSTDTANALSANQGRVLNNKFASYLPLAGGTMTGTINSLGIVPTQDNKNGLGTADRRYSQLYAVNAYRATNVPYTYSSDNTVLSIVAGSKSNIDNSFGSLPNKTIAFCW